MPAGRARRLGGLAIFAAIRRASSRLILIFFSRHRQPGMGSDPIDGIFFGSEFSKVVHGVIPPPYLHTPNVTFLHRQ
jgi:hypothetical protein